LRKAATKAPPKLTVCGAGDTVGFMQKRCSKFLYPTKGRVARNAMLRGQIVVKMEHPDE
jgi:hypothetical protein